MYIYTKYLDIDHQIWELQYYLPNFSIENLHLCDTSNKWGITERV